MTAVRAGIYKVVFKHTSRLIFPVLGDVIDGKFSFRRFKKHEIYITSEEIFFAYERGYDLHIIDSLVSENMADIYGKFINTAYEKRKKYKKLMMQVVGKDPYEYFKYDLLQTIEKLTMNRTHGKMGWAEERDVSNFIASDTNFILEQFSLGNITQIQEINSRYSLYSDVQKSAIQEPTSLLRRS